MSSQNAPRWIDAEAIHAALPYRALVEALREAFAEQSAVAPPRAQHRVERPDAAPMDVLSMPAWRPGSSFGLKVATVAPGNAARGLPTIQALYLLFDGVTGTPRALFDAGAITLRRTSCASALAADALAREDASRLAMIGAGALAPHLVRAHASVRPIRAVRVWNRSEERARALAAELAEFDVEIAPSVEDAARGADIVSCATMSETPLVRGAWLEPGVHLDLVGAYRPAMRESDGEALAKAELFVDTLEGAMDEAGDILQAIDEGAIERRSILGDLTALARGEAGRSGARAITAFKSCGASLEDLVAAELALRAG